MVPSILRNLVSVLLWQRNGMELGRPIFVLVQDLEMGFEKIVKIAHARGGNGIFSKCSSKKVIYSDSLIITANIAVCKRQNAISKLKAEVS